MVINKVTPNCNLDCSYCSAVATSPDGSIEKISDEVFQRSIELFVGQTREPAMEWLFHGGEPLLLSSDWFREAMDRIEQVARANPHLKHLAFSMQTNAVPLKQEHLDLLVERQVMVSSSLDGTPELHDLQRGRGRAVLRNIQRLAEAGVGGGVITILTPDNVEHVDEILDFFADHGIHGVKLNTLACVGRGAGARTVTGEQYAAAFVSCLERMARTGRVEPLNNDLVVMLEAFLFGRDDNVPDHQNCYSYTCSGGKFFFGLEHNGDVYPCGRASDTGKFNLFNVLDPEHDEDHVRQTLMALHHKDAWYVRCFLCDARRICSFGCPAFEDGNPEERQLQCTATKELYRIFVASPRLVEQAGRALEGTFTKQDHGPPGISVEQ